MRLRLWQSLLLLLVSFQGGLVADDVRAPVLVNGYLASLYHLIHPADRVLAVVDLLFPFDHLLLHLLDLGVLLLDLGGQLLIVEPDGLLLVELLGLVDMRTAPLGSRLEQVDSPPVCSYKIELVRKENNSVHLLEIIVEASNAFAIAGSSSIIRSFLEATLSLRSRIFS